MRPSLYYYLIYDLQEVDCEKKFKVMKKIYFLSALFILFISSIGTHLSAQTNEKDVTIIELNQDPGAFQTTELNLVPGKYQFRIVNQSVDKEVGFVIQKASDKSQSPMKTAVENSFASKTVKKGEFAYTGIVELKSGEYVYSCPLNPTPHYTIRVK